MNRREVILFAGLVNVALILILFITAGKNDKIKEENLEPIAAVQEMIKDQGRVINNEKNRVISEEDMETAIINVNNKTKKVSDDIKEDIKENIVEVVVKPGDYLEKIASLHHVSVEDLVAINDLHSSTLRIGQKLKLPAKKEDKVAPSQETNVEAKYYVVKNGDNPWLIAIKHKIPLKELLELNNLSESGARSLRPGDRLRVG